MGKDASVSSPRTLLKMWSPRAWRETRDGAVEVGEVRRGEVRWRWKWRCGWSGREGGGGGGQVTAFYLVDLFN